MEKALAVKHSKTRILFLGLFFTEQQIKECARFSKNGLQMATHLFQDRLIRGFNQNSIYITFFNIPPIGSFPLNYRKLFINYSCNGKKISYINLPIIKHIQQKHKLFKNAKKSILDNKIDTVIIYSLYEPFLYVGKKIKKIFPSVKVGLIQTDSVPGRNDMYKGIKYYVRGTRLLNYTTTFDFFIVLSKFLTEPLRIANRPWIVVDCMCDEKQKMSMQKSHNDRIFLYTGSTNKEYGIMTLISAFITMPFCTLWICGNGNCDREIKLIADKHSNIKYFGFLGQKEIEKKRNECDYLINPRVPSGTYTLYSFPSKTAEYLCSGKPLIMYKLESLGNEYSPFINFLTSRKKDGIASEIKNIIESDYEEMRDRAMKARNFMLDKKTSASQAKRIVSFIDEMQ